MTTGAQGEGRQQDWKWGYRYLYAAVIGDWHATRLAGFGAGRGQPSASKVRQITGHDDSKKPAYLAPGSVARGLDVPDEGNVGSGHSGPISTIRNGPRLDGRASLRTPRTIILRESCLIEGNACVATLRSLKFGKRFPPFHGSVAVDFRRQNDENWLPSRYDIAFGPRLCEGVAIFGTSAAIG